MEWRRAQIARLTTKTILALSLFLAATAGTFVTGSSSANAAPFDFLKNRQLYDSGADIRSLQNFFNTHGFLIAQSGPGSTGKETSFFGLATFQALRAFQAAHGLPSTGFFGPLTRAAINSGDLASSTAVQATAPNTTTIPTGAVFIHALIEGQRGADVTELQQILIKQGFLGAGDDTGYFGPLTAKAVAAFQAAHNIDPLGGVGPLTRAVLNSLLSILASSHNTPSTTSAVATTTASTSTTTPSLPPPLPGYAPGQIILGGGGSSSGGGGGSATPPDTTSPSAPTNLAATPASASQINLSWNASTDNVGVTGYNVYRDGTLVGTASTNNYSDTGLSPSALYAYTVTAHDAAGNVSTSSTLASGVTSAGPDAYGTTWNTLKIGAGGFIHGIDIQCDQGVGRCNNSGSTTKVARPDTYGAYWFNPNASSWQQIVSATSFPDSLFNNCTGGGCGAYEIRIAPTNTSHFYMYFGNGNIYSTLNRGATWTRTGFANVPASSNDGTTPSFGPFMAVDPANENIVVTGTPSSGAFYTTNGGTTWTRINGLCTPTVPSGANQGGGYLIAFDPSSGVIGGATQGIYISCYGTGVYHSTTGVSGTFSLINSTGMPTTFQHMKIDSVGTLYVVDNNNDYLLNWYSGGTWSSATIGSGGQGPLISVAIDPSNNNKLTALGQGGNLSYTTTGPGGTWSGLTGSAPPYQPPTRTAADIPWLANTNESYMSAGDILYDAAQSNTLYSAEGIGVWYTNPSSSVVSSVNYTSQSAAIEVLVRGRPSCGFFRSVADCRYGYRY